MRMVIFSVKRILLGIDIRNQHEMVNGPLVEVSVRLGSSTLILALLVKVAANPEKLHNIMEIRKITEFFILDRDWRIVFAFINSRHDLNSVDGMHLAIGKRWLPETGLTGFSIVAVLLLMFGVELGILAAWRASIGRESLNKPLLSVFGLINLITDDWKILSISKGLVAN